MTHKRLRHVAQVNPSSPGFDRLPEDAEVSFLRMESVWPGKWRELSEVKKKHEVISGFTRFQDGDILVPKITPTFEASRSILVDGLKSGAGAGTTELHVVRPGGKIYPPFLMYVMHSHGFLLPGEAEMYGVAGQKRVPDDFLRDFMVWVPGVAEQRRISDFLDSETRKVDEVRDLISGQLTRSSERRRSVLDSLWAISRGHARVRLGYVTSLVTSGSRGWSSFIGDSGSVFFRSANLFRDSILPNLDNVVFADIPESEKFESTRSRIDSGDVLVGITGANAGWVALADKSVSGGNVSQHVCLVRPVSSLVYGKWLAYLISSPVVQGFLMGVQYGGAKTQLSLPDIRNIRIPAISLEEQKQAASQVEEEVLQGESQSRLWNRQIDLLEERKRALITAAVTGQIDVTTARGADLS